MLTLSDGQEQRLREFVATWVRSRPYPPRGEAELAAEALCDAFESIRPAEVGSDRISDERLAYLARFWSGIEPGRVRMTDEGRACIELAALRGVL